MIAGPMFEAVATMRERVVAAVADGASLYAATGHESRA
ncbi:protein of unknown function [Methylorubrum extorquens DM4]|uniref:Uncharacterized protein n=1 Tax=Methylorubrum extorquens (strain DSM 6343 / CIP 106787 / DM4) TaxID=661410 RepID=C7CEI9_METED|nr:protein of unknown function [Methylorubrum extorquens DM4]